MTIFGLDGSSYQADLHLGAMMQQGYEFFAIKCTEGAGYVNPGYVNHLAEAKSNHALFTAYHFLRSDASPTSQAQNLARHIVDKSIPVAVDCEPEGSSKPNMSHVRSFAAACRVEGLRMGLLYYPEFWWQQTGQPDLSRWTLWAANYPSSAQNYGSVLYNAVGGDHGRGWGMYGGSTPLIWQFSSSAKVDGHNGLVDVNAFKGTRGALTSTGLFKDFAPSVTPPAPPKPPTPPAPPAPTRVATGKAKILDGLADLDDAVRHGRTGTVRIVASGIRLLANRLPNS